MATRFVPDMVLDDRYRLVQFLSAPHSHAQTWHAQTPDNQPVIVKMLASKIIDNDPPIVTDMFETMSALADKLDLTNRPTVDGVVGWRDCLWLDDTIEPKTLLIGRPYINHALLDDLQPESYAKTSDQIKLIEQMEQFLPALEHVMVSDDTFRLLPSNLMIGENSDWLLVDHGIQPLYQLMSRGISYEYNVSQHWLFRFTMYGLSESYNKDFVIDSQVMLASLYYYLRVGRGIFANRWHPFRRQEINNLDPQAFTRFLQSGKLNLTDIENAGERIVLEKALRKDAEQRYTTASDFLTVLKKVIRK